jgi:hypothetical protein
MSLKHRIGILVSGQAFATVTTDGMPAAVLTHGPTSKKGETS